MTSTITRRKVLLGTGAAIAAPMLLKSSRAKAAEFTYKYTNDLPLDNPLNIRMTEAANRIREGTSGRLEIQIFPSSQLGSATDALSQLRAGAIEFFTLSGLVFSTVVPGAAISGIGFAFPDYATVWKALDGDLGAYIRSEIAKTGNVIALEKAWDLGFRYITSSGKAIITPADLDGFKIRVPVSPLWTSMFKAFGASPISVNSSEMYSALQTKIAEGQETPLSSIWSLKLYEVQKQLSKTRHMWDGMWFLINRQAWERLPDDVRTVAAKHLNQAALNQRADLEVLNGKLQPDLEAKGMVFHDVDQQAFREKLRSAGFFAEWKKKFGDEAWAKLEKYCGSIS